MALVGLVVEFADVVTVAILNLHFFIIIAIFLLVLIKGYRRGL